MKKIFVIAMMVLLMAGTAHALNERGNWTFTGDIWFENNVEFDGEIDLDDATITATEKITATHIQNPTRHENLPVTDFRMYSITSAEYLSIETSPQIMFLDGIPALTFQDNSADSVGVSSVSLTFALSPNYVGDLSFRLLGTVSTGVSPASYMVGWSLWYNDDDGAIAAASNAQTAVGFSIDATTTNEVLTLTPNASALAALSAGSVVTLNLFNATTESLLDLPADPVRIEIKNVQLLYTSTM
ncbi:MAG TPA: hypothetical protein VMW90_03015 [Acidobacteriota bacterium]|nr:hypothetical protein [Acidobacteriota bacterium]